MKKNWKRCLITLGCLGLTGALLAWWAWPRQTVVVSFVGFGAAPDARLNQGRYAIFSVKNRSWGRIHFIGDSLELRVQRGGEWQREMAIYGYSHFTLAEMDAGLDRGESKLLYAEIEPARRPAIAEPFIIGLAVFDPPHPVSYIAPDWALSLLPSSLQERPNRTYWSEAVTP